MDFNIFHQSKFLKQPNAINGSTRTTDTRHNTFQNKFPDSMVT